MSAGADVTSRHAPVPRDARPLPCSRGCLLSEQRHDVATEFTRPGMLDAQERWAAIGVPARLRVVRRARHAMAAAAEDFAASISPALPRNTAETLSAEVWPLLEAFRFLERNAERLLAPRRLGSKGRPWWLGRVDAEIHREPLGDVLVIAPANFPLFLPGVQVIQALACGNRVVWKPAPGGRAVALLFAEVLRTTGLPDGLLQITDESVQAAHTALEQNPAKVIFTGSHNAGTAVLAKLAETATPAIMELSGADAVVVMPGADLPLTARAVAFGLRLNGAQVCMSPRRLFAEPPTMLALLPLLERELAAVAPVTLAERTASQLRALVEDAVAQGAVVRGDLSPASQRPLLITNARTGMRVAQSDVFAPVVSLLELPSLAALPEACNACPYSLTIGIFCARAEERKARALGRFLRAGTVLINDLIAPTADPRVPFGGRGASGFGSTRGAEGLLEMTAPKVLLVRRGGAMRHLDTTTNADTPLLANLIRITHAGTWRERLAAMKNVAQLGRARGAVKKETHV